MFRVQNNVPEIYPDKSRDFQMFCRLFDVSFNSVKQSIDSIQYITDTQSCDARLLPLLKSKLGFFTELDLSDTEIRYVLQAFPTIVRYKGSQQAIKYVTNLYSRLISSIATSEKARIDSNKEEYRIEISSEKAIDRSQLLFQLLKYVLPTGYVIDYFVTKYNDIDTQLFTTNSLLYNVDLTVTSFLNMIKKDTEDAFENNVLGKNYCISCKVVSKYESGGETFIEVSDPHKDPNHNRLRIQIDDTSIDKDEILYIEGTVAGNKEDAYLIHGKSKITKVIVVRPAEESRNIINIADIYGREKHE